MRLRLVALAALALLAVGCGVPGGKEVSPVPGETLVSGAPTGGDPAAGKAVFAKNACASCHTFTPAGATGKVGPDLDHLPEYAQKANVPLAQYAAEAITSPPAPYVPPGFPKNAMPTNYGTQLTSQQLADLVAFLTQGH